MSKAYNRLLPLALLALALSLAAAKPARAQEEKSGWLEVGQVRSQAGAQQQVARADVAPPEAAPQQQPQPTPTPLAPLTGEQKIKRSLRRAFLSPASYAIAAFNGGIRQIGEDRLPHKDTEDELADWGSTTARVFASRTTYGFFGNGVYPALFKQDPRYERAPNKGVGRRVAHAVSRLFVTRGDDGSHQPNFSRFAGAATSSALANVWERSTPGHDRLGADATLKRFGMSFVSGAIGNLFREFAPDFF
jgi:hypothetical protein